MKFLRDIPVLIKKHYEKVLLALALLGLIGAVLYLNQLKTAENDKIEEYSRETQKKKTKPIASVDLEQLGQQMKRATNPAPLGLIPPHNLLNPVKWQRRPDGAMIKVETGRESGPYAVEIQKIAPLNLTVSLEGQSGSGVNMSAWPETNRLVRQKIQSFITTNSASERVHRSRLFSLRELKVTPEGPLAEIEMIDGTKASVSVGKPFIRVEGYRVDLNYAPDKKTFTDRRVGDQLTLSGEDYNIVAINPNEIVVSARSNDRRTTIRNNAAQ